MNRWTAQEGIAVLIGQVNAELAKQLAILLQEKHLYQKVTIDADALALMVMSGVLAHEVEQFKQRFQQASSFVLLGGQETPPFMNWIPQSIPQFKPTNIKLFCSKCDRREAFSPLWSTDATYGAVTSGLRPKSCVIPQPKDTFQLYVLLYRCESCLEVIDTMLVRRVGWRFSIEGRSPMEDVEVEKYIPAAERKWFKDALVAAYTGKTLAAIFYLRTFVEQFARRQTGRLADKVTGDTIMSEYSDMLPEGDRDRMPSLREWYEKLSSKLHTGDEDEALFLEAKKKIEEHFDFRRLFKLDAKVPVKKSPAGGDSANQSKNNAHEAEKTQDSTG